MGGCRHDRRDARDMVRCGICYIWYHEDCLANPIKPPPDSNWWLCASCRLEPHTLTTLTDSVNKLCGLVEILSNEKSKLRGEINSLKDNNALLSAQIHSLKDIRPVQPAHVGAQANPPRLIIGDSTIRDVVSTDSSCLHNDSHIHYIYIGAMYQNIWALNTHMTSEQ